MNKSLRIISKKKGTYLLFLTNLFLLFSINLTAQTDTCSSATVLTVGSSCSTTNYNVLSSYNNDGGIPCSGTSYRDGWYSFTTNATTTSILIDGTSNRQMGLAIYSGTGACNTLVQVACIVPNSANASLAATVLPNTTYSLRIMRTNNNSANNMTGTICIYASSSPSNNSCSSATNLPCGTTNLNGTTVGTTNIINGTACSMANYGVWYSFIGDGNNATILATTTSYDIEMSISSGSCGSLTNISCQDVALSSGTETYSFLTTLGNNYYIYIAYYASGNTTTGTFTISRTCSIPSNPCTSIPNIASCGTTTNATIASGTGIYNPSSCGWTTPGNEQIYTFTPTSTGNYTISQVSSFSFIDYQFKLASLGCNNSGWTCIDDMSGAATSPQFTMSAGIQYYILLDPESATGGTISFSLNCPLSAPTNDDCINAIALSASSACNYVTFSNAGATTSIGSPAPSCSSYSGGDVWFSTVVPSNGILTIDSQTGIITDGGMELYSGNCLGLTSIGCDDDSSNNGLMPSITITALTPGQTIYIRFWEYGNDNNGTFGICVTSPLPPTNDNCSGAISLATNPTVTCTINNSTNSLGATQSQIGCAGNADDDVWFQFTATDINHTITVTPTTLNNAVFEVFNGNCSSLTSLICVNNTTGSSIETTTLSSLIIGATYFIRVYSNANASGQGIFNICITTPCNIGTGLGTSSMGCPTNIAGGLALNGLDPAPIINCTASTCTSLEANYFPLGQTTNYSVQSIAYNPPYQFGCLQNSVSINVDDVWSPTINLPFNFCYYGNTYSQCLIGSNGSLTFDQTSNAPSGYSTWSFANNLPSTTLFLNTIFGAYHDIDPSKGGEVGWELITLNSGCRALVASWFEIPMFSSACNSQLYTGMIVLYENTNIIEVYIKEKNVCASWNSGNAVVGVQNSTGTQAVVAPNRNSTDADWTTTNEAWRFIPSGTSITSVTWYEGIGTSGAVIGNTNIINVCPSATTTYTAKVSYIFCNGTTLDLTDPTTIIISNRKTWNGFIDSDWNKPLNWTPNNSIPNSSDCVIIPVTANNPIISGSNYNGLAGTLSIYNSATLTVNSNNNITVTDWVNVQATGTFLIMNSASLIQVNNVANTGNIIYKRTANNIRSLDYVYWSSPVAGFNVNNIVSPLVSGPIWRWNPIISNPNGGQGNWENATGDTMLPAKGYIVRGPSSFSPTTFTALNGSFTGVPNNGNINYTISRGADQNTIYHQGTNGTEINNFSDNWNLVGNPYPSAIRGSQFLFNNNSKIEGNIRLWTHGTLPSNIASPFYNSFVYNYNPGDYFTYNFTGSSCCPAAPADLFIGAGQGFFVQMKDGPTGSNTIVFNNSLRSATFDNSLFYRDEETNNFSKKIEVENIVRNRIWLDLIDSNNTSDRTLFGYIQGATMGKDTFFDCKTLNTGSMAIYSLINSNEKYLIQGRQLPFNTNDEVPIGIHIQNAGTYNIALAGIDGLFNFQNIYLKDKQLDIIHDLKIAPYRFTTMSGTLNERFKIVYINDASIIKPQPTSNVLKVIANENISIDSSIEIIESITVYDVNGKKLETYNTINSNVFTISNLIKNNSTLFLQIKLKSGVVVNQKVIY